MDCPIRGPLPPLTVEGADRINLFLSRPITLTGQTEKISLITTSVREILLKLRELMPKGSEVTLFGSSVVYLIDGDFTYSKKCLGDKAVGGVRPIPQDFDISLYSPEASYDKRWEVYSHFVAWVLDEIRKTNPNFYQEDHPRVALKKLGILLSNGVWNCSDSQAINQFLYLALKDEKDKRYEFRLTGVLNLPHLFSIERIKVLFDQTISNPKLIPDDTSGLECIKHWNQGIAFAENIALMDPLAWVKLASKMSRGILFRPEDITAITKQAMDRSLWRSRRINDLSTLIGKGVDPLRPRKSLHYLYHAVRLLPETEEHPIFDDPPIPVGSSEKEKLLVWIARRFFRGKREFIRSLKLLSNYVSLASLVYPAGYQSFLFRRISDQELLIQLGNKRSDLCLFVPWINPFECFQVCEELQSIFKVSPLNLTAQLKREWEEKELLQEIDPDRFIEKFQALNWEKKSLTFSFLKELLCRQGLEAILIPLYPYLRNTELRATFLKNMRSYPYEAKLFVISKDNLYPEELEYLSHKYSEETASQILYLIHLKELTFRFIRQYLKPDMSSLETFTKALCLKRGTPFISEHYPVYSDVETPIVKTFERSSHAEALAVYYSHAFETFAKATPDDELGFLVGLIKLYPSMPSWLMSHLENFIDKDFENSDLYYFHWKRAIPMLSHLLSVQARNKLLPSHNFQRFQQTASRLLKASELRHLTHLFAIIRDLEAVCLLTHYTQNIYSDLIRKMSALKTEETEKRYLYELSLDALHNFLRKKKPPQALMEQWEALDRETKSHTSAGKLESAYKHLILQVNLFDMLCYYRLAGISRSQEELLTVIISNFFRFYDKIDDSSFKKVYLTIKRIIEMFNMKDMQSHPQMKQMTSYYSWLVRAPCQIM